MRRTRRRRNRRRSGIAIAVVVLGCAGGWWLWPDDQPPGNAEPSLANAERGPTQNADEPTPAINWAGAAERGTVGVAHAGDTPETGTANADLAAARRSIANGIPLVARRLGDDDDRARDSAPRRNEALEKAKRDYEAGQVVAARGELNRLLQSGLTSAERSEVRRWLRKAAEETIFSSRRFPNDPLIDTYKIQSGDALIRIGKRFDVPHEVLMRINGIRDATKIRAGDTIKVLRGPFHAKIFKSQFRIDVYLQDVFVRSFPVGIGQDGATPLGKWEVKERLPNPTYYPSASAAEKRIIAADDPKNPLGEHWIGLTGLEGDAVGQIGYGIHGTIAPESIGKAASLGCVRLRNEDVAFLYGLLRPGKSTVTILP